MFLFFSDAETRPMIKLQDVIDVFTLSRRFQTLHVRPHVSKFFINIHFDCHDVCDSLPRDNETGARVNWCDFRSVSMTSSSSFG